MGSITELNDLRDEIRDLMLRDVMVYVNDQNTIGMEPEYLDCLLEQGNYMKDIPIWEGGTVREVYYYQLKE